MLTLIVYHVAVNIDDPGAASWLKPRLHVLARSSLSTQKQAINNVEAVVHYCTGPNASQTYIFKQNRATS